MVINIVSKDKHAGCCGKDKRANKDIVQCQNLHISTMQFSQLSFKKAQEDLNFIILKQDFQLLFLTKPIPLYALS